MSADAAARARLESMQVMHRLLQQQNLKLEQTVQEKQKLEQKKNAREAALKRREIEKTRTKGIEWKKQRYRNRMMDRAKAVKFEQRSPRYRPAHSNYVPSSKTGIPKTGDNGTNIRYSNFPRESRFAWQRVKDRIPGPSDYNPNHSNPMEQYAYVDYVRPYANNEEKEAQREQKLKPGILKLQDKEQNVVSLRNRLLGTQSHAVQRAGHSSFGTDQRLRQAIREDAGVEPESQVNQMLLLNDNQGKRKPPQSSETLFASPLSQSSSAPPSPSPPQPQRGSTSRIDEDIRDLRRQLERVNANLQHSELQRKMSIRQFQQNVNDLQQRSRIQEEEMRTVGHKLKVHQDALGSLRTTSAELVGTLLDMAPIFTKDKKLIQPFNVMRSKALRVHQAVEDTLERFEDEKVEGRIVAVDEPSGNEDGLTPEKSSETFVQDTRRQNMNDHTIKLDALDKYRNKLGQRGSQNGSRRNERARRLGNGEEEDPLPPPPPPPTEPDASPTQQSTQQSPPKIPMRRLSTMTSDQIIDYLFQVCVHHREKSKNRFALYNGEIIIGVTEFLRILRDAGILSNHFHFDSAVFIFRKHSMGSSGGGGGLNSMSAIGNDKKELVMSTTGFHAALYDVSQGMYPITVPPAERNRRLLNSHLIPLANYLNDHEEHGRLTYEEEQNLDHFLNLNVVEYLILHQSALQQVFTHAAGYNQTPPVECGTWMQARKHKWTMTLDQLLEYLKSIGITPEHVRRPDLDRAMRCATNGNHLLHGISTNEINYAQLLEILGSLAINCFGPGTNEEHRHLTTPLLRLQFLCMRIDGITPPAALAPSNKHGARSFKAAEKMMLKEEEEGAEDQKASNRKRRVTLSLIGM